MAVLNQDPSSKQIFYGWYGTCPESSSDECSSFDLFNKDGGGNITGFKHPEIYYASITFSDNKSEKSFASYLSLLVGKFGLQSLECGKPYKITINEGSGSIDIPEFSETNIDSSGPELYYLAPK